MCKTYKAKYYHKTINRGNHSDHIVTTMLYGVLKL